MKSENRLIKIIVILNILFLFIFNILITSNGQERVCAIFSVKVVRIT